MLLEICSTWEDSAIELLKKSADLEIPAREIAEDLGATLVQAEQLFRSLGQESLLHPLILGAVALASAAFKALAEERYVFKLSC